MVESLLGSPLITRAQGFLTIGSGSSIETDVNRYLEYAHGQSMPSLVFIY